MTTENTALTVQARAALALESSTAETYLTELAVKSKAITAITNKDDRSGPRITSLRIQISDELGKMNVFELGNVLAYCQALPLKNKLAA